ncbi:MAG TPA: phosphate signaling complex protein PhoU [Clostridia bacterium]|nr:phosphate signaling complex protein PhoU [Clostridia bacterium]
MIRSRFQQGLDDLKEKLLAMGGLAESVIEAASQAYTKQDAKLCQLVFEREREINEAERRIDEIAVDLLAMQQPMASDLRFILAVLKINADLERVGDQAVNIAQRAVDAMQKTRPVDIPVDVPRMTSAVSIMIRRALQSFVEGQDDVAEAVLSMDNVVDRMKDEAFVALVRSMETDPANTRAYLDALLVTRNLERVADHATNIAEDVIFWVRGDDVRHHHGRRLEDKRAADSSKT